MTWITVEADVDIDDIVSEMSKNDRRRFFQSMQDEDYIDKNLVITEDGEVTLPTKIDLSKFDAGNDDFNNALLKLYNNGWKLTKEDEETIMNISKKLP